MKQYSIGYSPCPNDTFIFYGLTHGLIPLPGWKLDREILADVETLNNWALAGRLDITKLSFHALGHVLDNYVLLRSGAALGRGCGPLLVSGRPRDPAALAGISIAIPGRLTTAALLLRLFAPACRTLVEMRFDQIMPAILAGKVDAGVIIHESRFTFEKYGLVQIEDLGAWWEATSGHPIPLGGIAVRRSCGPQLAGQVDAAVKASLGWARANKAQGLSSYIKAHAQELDDSVIAEHVGLYVNEYTESLGSEGSAAIEAFLARGRAAGILPAHHADIFT